MSTPAVRNATRFIVILVVLLASSVPATAEIIEGVGIVYGGWDFSTQTSLDCAVDPEAGCDIVIGYVVDPPIGFKISTVNYATIAMLEDVAFEDLDEAPSDEALYVYGQPAQLGVTYVVHTTEGHFAKFRFTVLSVYADVQIEYVYQSDGSRSFVAPTPVEPSTWGAVKALYTFP